MERDIIIPYIYIYIRFCSRLKPPKSTSVRSGYLCCAKFKDRPTEFGSDYTWLCLDTAVRGVVAGRKVPKGGAGKKGDGCVVSEWILLGTGRFLILKYVCNFLNPPVKLLGMHTKMSRAGSHFLEILHVNRSTLFSFVSSLGLVTLPLGS